MIELPTRQRYFLTGLGIGFVAVLCRQQGTFGALGCIGVQTYLAIRRENGPNLIKGFFVWAAGLAVGYIPAFLMFVLVPGYATAFFENIRLFSSLATGSFFPVSVPWPWMAPLGRATFGSVVRWVFTGIFFMAPFIFSAVGFAWAFYQKRHKMIVTSALVASVFLMPPYIWYVFVAPDISRLGLGIFPFLIGTLVALGNKPAKFKWPLVALLWISTIIVMLPNHPGWSSKRYVAVDIGGDKLKIYPETANYFKMLGNLVRSYAPNGQSFIAVPTLTTSYAVWRRKSPMRDIYSQLPRSEAFQKSEILRIESSHAGFAIIYDFPAFGSEVLRFKNTHPLIYEYIVTHFELLTGYSEDPVYQIYKSKGIA